jgi:nucleoside permease NupC
MEDEKENNGEHEAPRPESPAVQPEKTLDEAHSPTSQPTEQDTTTNEIETNEKEWVTGLKLAVIVAAITMASFLMLLDVSIVATVSPSSLFL